MYVKWFDTVMLYYGILDLNITFFNFLTSRRFRPPRMSRRLQETEPGRWMPALAGGDGGGHCR
ncbi:unnamed protein product, partial [Staurois parvus]